MSANAKKCANSEIHSLASCARHFIEPVPLLCQLGRHPFRRHVAHVLEDWLFSCLRRCKRLHGIGEFAEQVLVAFHGFPLQKAAV